MPEPGERPDGRYQLTRDLGRGAAGVVFEARHLFTGRFVAVKMQQVALVAVRNQT
jgi:serine/threonine protein kinase